MNWRLISMAAALGLTIAMPAQAATNARSAPVQVAAAQTQQDKNLRKQSKKPQFSVRQNQQKPQLKIRKYQPNVQPKVQHNLTIQNQNRVRVDRRLQNQNTLRVQRRYDWNLYRPGHRPPNWNQYRRFDRSQWQRNFWARHRYHWRPYYRPRGWYYRRWVFGMVLPTMFWTRDYWIDDYVQFALMDPPYGYVWVRYEDDALLVNVETGSILQVVYGVFY